jgi:hypothetical protein
VLYDIWHPKLALEMACLRVHACQAQLLLVEDVGLLASDVHLIW